MGFNGKDYVEVKLREIWLRDGDKNNKFFFFFFHKMANVCYRKNFLTKVKVNGVWLIEEVELKNGVSMASN